MTKTITLLGHVLLAIATTCSASAPTCSNCDISGLLTWVEDSGGVFSSKQEIRLENPNDKYSKLGVFATDIILQGTVLATIPWDIIIKGDDVAFDDEEDEDQENDEEEDEEENHEEISEPFLIECSTVRNLVKELAKAKSHYAPYLNYLQTQHETPLPSIWSEEGKQLLEQVLGGKNHPENLIGDATTRLSHQWLEMCGGEESALQAAMRVQQYADDGVLIPLKDLYRHRNGPYYNVDTFFTDEGYQIVARNMIRKGEQIHDSINQCEDCFEFWDENYGTPRKYSFR